MCTKIEVLRYEQLFLQAQIRNRTEIAVYCIILIRQHASRVATQAETGEVSGLERV